MTNTEEDNKLFVYYVLVYEKIVHELSLAWQIIAQKVLKIVDALAFFFVILYMPARHCSLIWHRNSSLQPILLSS